MVLTRNQKGMISFRATIKRFEKQGDKSGWTYIEIDRETADKIFPGNKKSFRVSGFLDEYRIENIALLPMGGGSFIMALNSSIRKGLKKITGENINVTLQKEEKEKPISRDLLECLEDDSEAAAFFTRLSKSHQRYFSNWIESAKTSFTKEKRIVLTIKALSLNQSFSEMIRNNKSLE